MRYGSPRRKIIGRRLGDKLGFGSGDDGSPFAIWKRSGDRRFPTSAPPYAERARPSVFTAPWGALWYPAGTFGPSARRSTGAFMSERTGVMFLNSAYQPGADTWIHNLLIRHLDRSRFAVEAAVTPGTDSEPSPSLQVLRTVPDLSLRPTIFGPSLTTRTSGVQKLRAVAELVPAAASLAGLVAHIRRRRIRVIHASDRPRDAISCVLLAKASGARSVIHVHVKCDTWMSRPVRFAFRT